MIFGRRRKRTDDPTEASTEETAVEDETTTEETLDDGEVTAEAAEDPSAGSLDLAALDEAEWRHEGPFDIREVEAVDAEEEGDDADGLPRIDLGSLVVTGVPGSELRLQVSEETSEIVSAMLVIHSGGAAPNGSAQPEPETTSALELAAFAAPRRDRKRVV